MRADRESAEQIRDALNARFGTDQVYLDVDSIPAGASFADEIAAAIDRSSCVIAVLSPDFFRSEWARAQTVQALASQKLVIPVVVRECVVESPLNLLQALDLRSGPYFESALQELVDTVGARG